MEKNRKITAISQFLFLGWVIFAWPAFSFAAGISMSELKKSIDSMRINPISSNREKAFSVDQKEGNNIFILQENEGVLNVEDGGGAVGARKAVQKKNNGEEMLSVSGLQINSVSGTDPKQGDDVNLLSIAKPGKKSDFDKKEKTTAAANGISEIADEPMTALDDGVWNVGRDAIFGSRATFEDSVDFLAQITFMDRITFADRDMAGSATIKKGKDSVHVSFKNSYSIKPHVVATPNNDFALFRVTNADEEGFDIVVKDNVSDELNFTWHSLAIFEK